MLNNVIHIPVSTGQQGPIKRAFFGYTPATEYGTNEGNNYVNKGPVDIFMKEATISWLDFANPAKEGPFWRKFRKNSKKSNQTFEIDGKRGVSHINYLKLTNEIPIQGGRADIYLVSPVRHFRGRLTAQLYTSDKKVLSQSLMLNKSLGFDDLYSGVISYGSGDRLPEGDQDFKKTAISFDEDNAMGMFLYTNGKYGPLLLGKDITEGGDEDVEGKPTTELQTIAVICTNKVSSAVPNLDGFKAKDEKNIGFNNDHDEGYRHYAMGLISHEIPDFPYHNQNFFNTDNDFRQLLDQFRFPDPYKEKRDKSTRDELKYRFYLNRNGRVYTNYMTNYCTPPYGDSPNTFCNILYSFRDDYKIKADAEAKLKVSPAFLPTSGQFHNLIVNLTMLCYYENMGDYYKCQRHFPKPQYFSFLDYPKGCQQYREVGWGPSEKYSMLNKIEPFAVADMMNFYAGLRNESKWFDKIGDAIWCSNATRYYGGNHSPGFYALVYAGKRKVVLRSYNSDRSIAPNGKYKISIVPFYAVNRYGGDNVSGEVDLPTDDEWGGWIDDKDNLYDDSRSAIQVVRDLSQTKGY